MTDNKRAKHPTQAVTGQDRTSEPESLVPKNERGAGGGGPYEPEHADKEFHGGQSNAAYHGHGQLGEEEVEGQDNPNAPSEEP